LAANKPAAEVRPATICRDGAAQFEWTQLQTFDSSCHPAQFLAESDASRNLKQLCSGFLDERVIDGVSRTGVYEELCIGRRIAGIVILP
jgi:hypothetical protein